MFIKQLFSHNIKKYSLSENTGTITLGSINEIGQAASIKIIVQALVTEESLMSTAENLGIHTDVSLN